MSRLNNLLKFIVTNVNVFFFILALFLFGFSLYLLGANWGELDPGFFLGSGIVILLFSSSLALASCLGCQGVNNQVGKYGFWTGRKIIGLYMLIFFATCGAELYFLSVMLTALSAANDTRDLLIAEPESIPPFRTLETFMAEKFNRFFFGSASSCTAVLYDFFWGWVNGNCPDSIDQTSCQGCEDYSITFCEANERLCFERSTISAGNAPLCPYIICRLGILEYFIDRIPPLTIFITAFAIFQLIHAFMTLMLFCYHPRDTLEQILYKSGTITHKPNHHHHRRHHHNNNNNHTRGRGKGRENNDNNNNNDYAGTLASAPPAPSSPPKSSRDRHSSDKDREREREREGRQKGNAAHSRTSARTKNSPRDPPHLADELLI